MPRESKKIKQERAIEACNRIAKLYPQAEPSLDFANPFQCVIAVSLSAQTTDAAVNKVTKVLFKRWSNPQKLAAANLSEVQDTIRTIGFFRQKAKHIIETSQMIVSDFGGEVPQTMEELQKLPGVGRKTANIVLNLCFNKVQGIAVDTHVNRIAHRLALVPLSVKNANETEKHLLKLLPQELWRDVNSQWILFGRQFCSAKSPNCPECPLADICPTSKVLRA